MDDSITVLNSQEAENYVDSIMSTQKATKVNSPAPGGKKRRLSGEVDVSQKKVKNGNTSATEKSDADSDDNDESGDETVNQGRDSQNRVKRQASRRKSKKSPRRNVFRTEAVVHDDSEANDVSVKHLLAALSSDMHMMYNSLHDRIDKFEAGLEQRISNKVAQLLDKRVNTELSRIRNDVDDRMETFKETIRSEMSDELEEVQNNFIYVLFETCLRGL